MTVRNYTADELVALLPFPAHDANKYSRGTLTLFAGSERYPGAACLAALAAQRMGAGYTQVVTAPEAVPLVRACRPSLVVRAQDGGGPADLPPAVPGKPRAYAVGPGFDGADAAAHQLTLHVLKQACAPVLVDGGALAALPTKKGRRLLERRFVRGLETVVTPHAGEAARLAEPLGLPTGDPADLAQRISLAYGAVAVLKGPVTYISDGEGVVAMDAGTPALAKAGTGDVLAGMVGALLAQGLGGMDAAVLGTTLHALAARSAADRLTAISVVPEDVVDDVPAAIMSLVTLAEGQRA